MLCSLSNGSWKIYILSRFDAEHYLLQFNALLLEITCIMYLLLVIIPVFKSRKYWWKLGHVSRKMYSKSLLLHVDIPEKNNICFVSLISLDVWNLGRIPSLNIKQDEIYSIQFHHLVTIFVKRQEEGTLCHFQFLFNIFFTGKHCQDIKLICSFG